MTGTWFNLKGGLWNRGGSDNGQRRWWWNSGGGYSSVLRQNWHGVEWGRCAQDYIGVWEESRSFRIRVRDKIRI
jgi:hypothetical protein